jgi:signal transduction histidine kinase
VAVADPKLVERFRTAARALGAAVAAVGALVFLGWALNSTLLNQLVAGRFIMQLNTGAAFVLAGLSLVIAPRRLWWGMAFAFGVLSIGAFVSGEYLYTAPGISRGRMEPETALNFVLFGAALALRLTRSPRALKIGQGLALIALVDTLLALFGQLYYTKFHFGITAYAQMTLGTALAFFALGVGVLLADPEEGLLRTPASDTTAGFMARRLLPAVVVGPFVLGWLTLIGEQQLHLYNGKFGLSIAVLSTIVTFVALVAFIQRSMDRADAQRQRLQALLLEEAERRHIARELHDEIGQSLTALKFHLEMVGRSPPEDGAQRIREARALVDELMDRVSNLSLDLRPPMLDDLGLLPALLWLVERYTSQTKIKVELQHVGIEKRFSPELETAAYRVVQEALTNVARHAGVEKVQVRAWANDGELGVQIADQGRGFDAAVVIAKGESSGVIGMRERARALGGQLTIDTRPGEGVRLTAEFPLGAPLSARLQ